jgi:hypothetical protein
MEWWVMLNGWNYTTWLYGTRLEEIYNQIAWLRYW